MTTFDIQPGDRVAVTDHPVHDLVSARWSPRAFDPRPVEDDKLRSVLEAARWAPSSGNSQPWHFIVATQNDAAEFERLLATLSERNQQWARHAPVLMAVVVALSVDREGNVTRRSYYDAGLAVANLVVQASALGLMVHQMAGFSAEKVRGAYAIPEGYEAIATLALGYLGDPDTLPDDLRERERAPRTRKPLAEFVYGGAWGETAPFLTSTS